MKNKDWVILGVACYLGLTINCFTRPTTFNLVGWGIITIYDAITLILLQRKGVE